jgi:hypothetical protein
MARLFPEDFDVVENKRRFSGELATLLKLKEELSDQYCVFHGVHWTKIEDDAAVYGEIDFLIINPYGKILAIEQKETTIERNKQGELVAIYSESDGQRKKKKIHSQVARNIQSLRKEFSKRYKNQSLHVEHLLFLPTALIVGELPANLTLGRVVDSSEAKYLPDIIRKILEDNPMPIGSNVADALTIQEFLSEQANVVPQMGVLGRSAKEMTTRLSSGLTEWAERLAFLPFRLWVQGTAGSGKTQLALKELRHAKTKGQTAMYLCFNRALADAMKISAPEPNNCMTFHELAGLLAKQNGQSVEFQEENIFPKLAQYLVENISLLNNQLDVLVVDEGQDFDKSWGDALISMVKEGGRVVWLEDPSQDLYGRWQTNWPEWVKISSPVNYRSPQRLVSLMNALELTNVHQEVGNGYVGMIPYIEPYQDGMEIEATERAIRDLVAEGYEPDSIAVLSYRGVVNSKVLSSNVTELAGLKVKKFTGFNSLGIASWSDGQIFVDTLFRFKGQCADAVILTEVDFEEWSENVKRRLFVGLTRARLTVSLVLTEKASELIDRKLGS